MSDEQRKFSRVIHNVTVNSREKITINGIKEILSFDECEVILVTVCGRLSIEGTGIHIKVLNINSGEVEVDGRINTLCYSDSDDSEKRSLLSRIFK